MGFNSGFKGLICVVRLLFVLFYVLFVCKCVLPPGDNPSAVNKYHTILYSARSNLFVSLLWRQGLLGKVPLYVRLYPCFPTTVIFRTTSTAELKVNLKSSLIIAVKWNKIQWHLFPGVYTMQVNSYWFPYTCICTPKIMLNYRPNGRRRLGRPLKRILDEADTGLSMPNSWRMLTIVMMMMMMMMMMYTHSSLTKRK